MKAKLARKLINVAAVKEKALQLGRERVMLDGKAKWTRVSNEFVERLERAVQRELSQMVSSAPTMGKTLTTQ